MNLIHDTEVNHISEFNLLNDILNLYRRTKNINIQHSPILNGCMNTISDRVKYQNF